MLHIKHKDSQRLLKEKSQSMEETTVELKEVGMVDVPVPLTTLLYFSSVLFLLLLGWLLRNHIVAQASEAASLKLAFSLFRQKADLFLLLWIDERLFG